MLITREYLSNYPYLHHVIEKDEKKLKQYLENPPTAEYGKVYGSNVSFPFQERGFTVSGPNVVDKQNWEKNISEVRMKLSIEKDFYNRLIVAIDELILGIESPRDKLVFEYLYHDGMTQQQVAGLLHIDQSIVSRTVDKYVNN